MFGSYSSVEEGTLKPRSSVDQGLEGADEEEIQEGAKKNPKKQKEKDLSIHHKMRFLSLTWMPKAAHFCLRKTLFIRLWGWSVPE